jgi:hypothetical protein
MSDKEVIAIKTTSNEEVVAKLVSTEDDHLVLEKPRALVMQQMQDGTVSLGMLPFMASANNPEFTTESDVKLYKKDIMAEVVAVPEPLAKAYLGNVSGIQLVQ